jgi:hypothetical protein
VAGGVLQIFGLLAILAVVCEVFLRRPLMRKAADSQELYGYPPSAETRCAWPKIEPEVEALRRKGAL